MADERVRDVLQSTVPLAVHCQDVVYRIRKKTVLSDVSFSVEKGQIAGLLGPNGAGKSSLMKILAGLNPPDSGQVQIYGQPAGPDRLREVAYLPDRARLPGWVTAREWLELASAIYPDWDSERAGMLQEALAVKLDTKISGLSRGEEARLQLLTCLARRAPLVILDEPFAGVDLLSRERIATSVVAELADGERTFLIATHDIRELESLFDKVIFIGDGRILGEESVDGMRGRGLSVESRYREVFA